MVRRSLEARRAGRRGRPGTRGRTYACTRRRARSPRASARVGGEGGDLVDHLAQPRARPRRRRGGCRRTPTGSRARPRPTATAAQPVSSSTRRASSGVETSPLAITGTDTAATTSAVMRWSAVPPYSSAAARGCTQSAAAPACLEALGGLDGPAVLGRHAAAHLHGHGDVDRAHHRLDDAGGRAPGRPAARRRRRSCRSSGPGSPC